MPIEPRNRAALQASDAVRPRPCSPSSRSSTNTCADARTSRAPTERVRTDPDGTSSGSDEVRFVGPGAIRLPPRARPHGAPHGTGAPNPSVRAIVHGATAPTGSRQRRRSGGSNSRPPSGTAVQSHPPKDAGGSFSHICLFGQPHSPRALPGQNRQIDLPSSARSAIWHVRQRKSIAFIYFSLQQYGNPAYHNPTQLVGPLRPRPVKQIWIDRYRGSSQ